MEHRCVLVVLLITLNVYDSVQDTNPISELKNIVQSLQKEKESRARDGRNIASEQHTNNDGQNGANMEHPMHDGTNKEKKAVDPSVTHIAYCGDPVNNQVGTLLSPNFPGNYTPSQNCTYTIVVGNQLRDLQLYIEAFSVEPGPDCAFDALVMATFRVCGWSRPSKVTYTFPEISGNFTIRFLSDFSVSGRGFVIRYTLALPSFATTPITPSTIASSVTSSVSASTPQCNPNSVCTNFCEGGYVYVSRTCYTCTCAPVSSNHLGKCGSAIPCPCLQYRRDEQQCPVCVCRNPPSNLPQTVNDGCNMTLYDVNGTFSSPHYPQMYLPSSRCSTTIMVGPAPSVLYLYFVDMDMEVQSECGYDGVEFLGVKVCGNHPRLYVDVFGPFTVRMFSDFSGEFKGFYAKYFSLTGLRRNDLGFLDSDVGLYPVTTPAVFCSPALCRSCATRYMFDSRGCQTCHCAPTGTAARAIRGNCKPSPGAKEDGSPLNVGILE